MCKANRDITSLGNRSNGGRCGCLSETKVLVRYCTVFSFIVLLYCESYIYISPICNVQNTDSLLCGDNKN